MTTDAIVKEFDVVKQQKVMQRQRVQRKLKNKSACRESSRAQPGTDHPTSKP